MDAANDSEETGGGKSPSRRRRPAIAEAFVSGVGGMLLIGLLYALHRRFEAFPVFFAPFGSSAVLVFAAPSAPFSQPRNVVFGHVLAALIGVAVYSSFAATEWWTVSLAGGLTIFCMVSLKTIHPPAGATALLPVLTKISDYAWVLLPVLAGSVIVVMVGVAYNNLLKNRRYPTSWM